MNFVVHSVTTELTIADRLGLPEYSYYFVLKVFRPVLETLGRVVTVSDPWSEVDPLYDAAVARGERCVFLSFSPPNKTPRGLRCPTIPVFAWEFDSIPDEKLHGNPDENWCEVLRELGHAITHSSFSVRVVRERLGADFDIVSIPAPVWDGVACRRSEVDALWADGQVTLERPGVFLDTRTRSFREAWNFMNTVRREFPLDLPAEVPGRPGWGDRKRSVKAHAIACYREAFRDLLPDMTARALARAVRATALRRRGAPEWDAARESPASRDEGPLQLSGLVYTSVFNPADGRKNWQDAVLAFCAAFSETEDATLVLKLTHRDSVAFLQQVGHLLYKQRPFRCRFVVVAGYLDEPDYDRLIAATTYAVNTSSGEGQCLPLMEYMSCGRPAVAPAHTGMADYIHAGNAFIIDSSLEPCAWPHDMSFFFRARRHRVHWESIVAAFRRSAQVYREEPAIYRRMSEASCAAQEATCSSARVVRTLRSFLSLG